MIEHVFLFKFCTLLSKSVPYLWQLAYFINTKIATFWHIALQRALDCRLGYSRLNQVDRSNLPILSGMCGICDNLLTRCKINRTWAIPHEPKCRTWGIPHGLCITWSIPHGLFTTWLIPHGLCTTWPIPHGLCTTWPIPHGLCSTWPIPRGLCSTWPISHGLCSTWPIPHGLCTTGSIPHGLCTTWDTPSPMNPHVELGASLMDCVQLGTPPINPHVELGASLMNCVQLGTPSQPSPPPGTHIKNFVHWSIPHGLCRIWKCLRDCM